MALMGHKTESIYRRYAIVMGALLLLTLLLWLGTLGVKPAEGNQGGDND